MTLEPIPVKASDQELVSKAQAGEPAAFEELVYRYDRKVLAIATSYTRNAEEAKDIYQEVFLRAYRSLAAFKSRSEFSTWLHRIVTNVCLTHQMRSRVRSHTPIDGEGHAELSDQDSLLRTRPVSPERYAENVEISKHVEEAMSSLSPQQKLVFTLKHYHGYKLKEIAMMMDCAEGTVKRYLFTATDKMRRRLKRIY